VSIDQFWSIHTREQAELWEEYTLQLSESESVAELNARDAEYEFDQLCMEEMTAAEHDLTIAELRAIRAAP
jgi:hypothetical protein